MMFILSAARIILALLALIPATFAASITTAVPKGVITGGPNGERGPEWCIQDMLGWQTNDRGPPYEYSECANATRGTKKEDFQTFCCDGSIIDTSQDLYHWWPRNFTTLKMDLENLVCCREGGRLLSGGIMPIDSDYTHCGPSSKPVPLVSLAATNTNNAALYEVTYESAQGDSTGGLHDWTRTETPMCMWIETANAAITMANVTVAAAEITTLPPPTTDRHGWPIYTSTSSSRWGDGSSASTGKAAATAAPTSFANRSAMKDATLFTSIGLSLGLLAIWIL